MRQRDLLPLFAAATIWPLGALAQQAEPARIGFLSPRAALSPADQAFLQGLQELGYVEGIEIEYRFAAGKFERLPDLASELARLQVDVIVAAVTQASLAAK